MYNNNRPSPSFSLALPTDSDGLAPRHHGPPLVQLPRLSLHTHGSASALVRRICDCRHALLLLRLGNAPPLLPRQPAGRHVPPQPRPHRRAGRVHHPHPRQCARRRQRHPRHGNAHPRHAEHRPHPRRAAAAETSLHRRLRHSAAIRHQLWDLHRADRQAAARPAVVHRAIRNVPARQRARALLCADTGRMERGAVCDGVCGAVFGAAGGADCGRAGAVVAGRPAAARGPGDEGDCIEFIGVRRKWHPGGAGITLFKNSRLCGWAATTIFASLLGRRASPRSRPVRLYLAYAY
ncbi:hypothetical protein EDC01DRAFT_509137 [Geopyxis carbonaria]|nr:hypothetical protein EDC01DRAFT_509137 [Geopyxis carbonaria]